MSTSVPAKPDVAPLRPSHGLPGWLDRTVDSGPARSLARPPARVGDGPALLRRFHRFRDPRDREELVRLFQPLARRQAMRYGSAQASREDLEQVAYVGLLKALDGYDPVRGTAFSSYAVPTILGELRRFFRDTGWCVHMPRAVQELAIGVRVSAETLTAELHRAPTVQEIAERVGVESDAVLDALNADGAYSAMSFDAPAGRDEDAASLSERHGTLDGGFELVEDREAVSAAARTLSDRERVVLTLRLRQDLTQSQIAEQLGVSQMQISRVMRRALARLSTVAAHQSAGGRQPVASAASGIRGSGTQAAHSFLDAS